MTDNSDEPNYRDISAPPDKRMSEYTYIERRAKLYDMIEEVGHYRNLPASRELGQKFGVSHTQILNDIQVVNEWIADNIGDTAETELEVLKNKAVQDLIDAGDTDKAYKIMREHYQMLQEMGLKEREPEGVEVSWREYIREQ